MLTLQYGSQIKPGKSFGTEKKHWGEIGTDLSTKDAEQDLIRN